MVHWPNSATTGAQFDAYYSNWRCPATCNAPIYGPNVNGKPTMRTGGYGSLVANIDLQVAYPQWTVIIIAAPNGVTSGAALGAANSSNWVAGWGGYADPASGTTVGYRDYYQACSLYLLLSWVVRLVLCWRRLVLTPSCHP